MKTFKNVEEHYGEIRRLFEAAGVKVLGVTVEYDDSCDPDTAFVITLRGRNTRMNRQLAAGVLTNYAYRIEWTS